MGSGEKSFQTIRQDGREMRKQMIIDAGRRLMTQKNPRSISMRDIANEVGITPASIYTYFDSQAQVFQEIFLCNLARIESMMDEHLDLHTNTSEADAMVRFGDLFNVLMSHEKTLQAIMLFLSEKNISERIGEKATRIWGKLNDHVAMFLKGIGIKNPDAKATHAVLASMIGTAVMFSHDSGKTENQYHVSKTDMFQALLSTFRPMYQ